MGIVQTAQDEMYMGEKADEEIIPRCENVYPWTELSV